MKRLILLVALAAACLGCALANLPPGTFPTPAPGTPPANPSPLCAAGNVSECYHRPPGSPWLYNCKGGMPTVTGPAECPQAPPASSCVIPDQGATKTEPGFPSPDRPPLDAGVAKRVNDAWLALLADRPDCQNVGGRCVLGASTDMMATLRRLVDKIREQGGCAGIQAGADEVTVLISPGKAQGVHAFVEAGQKTVGWAVPGAHRDTWSAGTAAPPKPPTGEPAGDTCEEPTPDATLFKLDVRWNSARTVAWVDATSKAKSPWCEEKYGPGGPWADPADPSKNRGTCPTRPEGHAQRKACDLAHGKPQWLLAVPGGFAPVASDDGDPFHVHAPAGATVKACRSTGPRPEDFDAGACSDPLVLTP